MHTVLKATKRYTTKSNLAKVSSEVELPESSKQFLNEYLNTDKLSDELGKDLALVFDNDLIFGFDYLHEGKKLLIPEINPILIFYSNALMSLKSLYNYKSELLKKSQDVRKINGSVDFKIFGNFFQFAVNTIINLQASFESFLNFVIDDDYVYISNNNREIRRPNIHDKIDIAVVDIKGKSFELEFEESYLLIKELIELRNDIIHLKPIAEQTNTKYKKLFRRIIDFEYQKAAHAVADYLNYYEPNLVEKCPCGKDYHLKIIKK
jgi:hypothetical protein